MRVWHPRYAERQDLLVPRTRERLDPSVDNDKAPRTSGWKYPVFEERLPGSGLLRSRPHDLLVAVRGGAILAGPQGPLWQWLLERKYHQAGKLARQGLDLRELPLQGKVQKRIVRGATRGLPKWPHFSLPPTQDLKVAEAAALLDTSTF